MQLTKTHGLSLVGEGPRRHRIRLPRVLFARLSRSAHQPTYADLMTQTDGAGGPRSYLASEASFAFLKDLESRNLVVPGRRRLRRTEGDSLDRRVSEGARRDGRRPSICRTSSSISIRTASGTRSAGTSRRCRSTARARSFARRPAAGRALAAASCRASVRWRRNHGTVGVSA